MMMRIILLACVLSFATFIGAAALQSTDACLATTGQRSVQNAGLSSHQAHCCIAVRGGAVKRKQTKHKHVQKRSSKHPLIRYDDASLYCTTIAQSKRNSACASLTSLTSMHC
jgi:hypothetical protein